MDVFTPEKRSAVMSAVRSKDTKMEVGVRRELHARGYRYRKHHPRLPGKPDLVFPRYGAVVLLHGCFWHGHNCGRAKLPATRAEFWAKKIRSNCDRDARNEAELERLRWRVMTVWECESKGKGKVAEVADRVESFLRDEKERKN